MILSMMLKMLKMMFSAWQWWHRCFKVIYNLVPRLASRSSSESTDIWAKTIQRFQKVNNVYRGLQKDIQCTAVVQKSENNRKVHKSTKYKGSKALKTIQGFQKVKKVQMTEVYKSTLDYWHIWSHPGGASGLHKGIGQVRFWKWRVFNISQEWRWFHQPWRICGTHGKTAWEVHREREVWW